MRTAVQETTCTLEGRYCFCWAHPGPGLIIRQYPWVGAHGYYCAPPSGEAENSYFNGYAPSTSVIENAYVGFLGADLMENAVECGLGFVQGGSSLRIQIQHSVNGE